MKVPPLFGDSVTAAEQTLSSLGLKWCLFGPPGANFVLTELSRGRPLVQVGSTVDLYLY